MKTNNYDLYMYVAYINNLQYVRGKKKKHTYIFAFSDVVPRNSTFKTLVVWSSLKPRLHISEKDKIYYFYHQQINLAYLYNNVLL